MANKEFRWNSLQKNFIKTEKRKNTDESMGYIFVIENNTEKSIDIITASWEKRLAKSLSTVLNHYIIGTRFFTMLLSIIVKKVKCFIYYINCKSSQKWGLKTHDYLCFLYLKGSKQSSMM